MTNSKKVFMGYFAVSAIMFGACDTIGEDDRYIEQAKPVIPTEKVLKTVLIQEFTGHACTNCPLGAASLHSIAEAYPGNVITVGLHAEGAGPNTAEMFGQDFRCDEAQVMYSYYSPSGLPCAVFNGTEMSSNTNTWYTTVSNLVGQEAQMAIDAECDYAADSRTLTVDYTVKMLDNIDGKLNVMVWVMENGIKGIQLNQGKWETEYIHNHVLRASLNGDWGEEIGKTFKEGQTISRSASMVLREDWVAENCQVIVYVFRDSDKAVQQATLADVIGANEVEPPHAVAKRLLIQEFTGHACTNCPQGAASLHSIAEAYPGRVISVGMHAEGAGPNTAEMFGQDFRCNEAQVMYSFYKPSGFPCAVFNGTVMSTNTNTWYSTATELLEEPTWMTIDAQSAFDPSDRTLSVDYSITMTDDIEEDLNVMVWVMENDIEGIQLNQGKWETDYIHNHVLRASLNGDWGTNLGKSFANGQKIKGNASMKLDEAWVAGNCQVVVYVFKNSDKSVQQSQITDVVVPSDDEE